jgi:hypothetical protein
MGAPSVRLLHIKTYAEAYTHKTPLDKRNEIKTYIGGEASAAVYYPNMAGALP